MNIGDRVGDYEIVAILGAGGMGQVYKVRNLLSERMEAMKILLPNLEGDAGLADRFLREIKVQAALDHPNIAKFHTAMRAGNQLVMFMEFVDGTSVAQMLEQGAIAPAAAVGYAAQVLDALEYAHALGVVHRDIKPANIMVTPTGTVKLMDFGIARMKADQRLTQAGGSVGSLHYMSPEQINGTELDGRADIYSLGIALYEMVTGRRPFVADSDFQLMSAHLMQAPPPPIEIIPGVPPDLNDIILMAIAKKPQERFQSAAAFRGALATLGMGIELPTHTMLPIPVMIPAPTNPVPPPLPMAAPPPQVHAQSAGSRRGLYMALGSVATLAVLIAAVIEGPKLMRSGSAGAQSVPVMQTAPVADAVPTSAAPAPPAEPTPAVEPVQGTQSPIPAVPMSTPVRPMPRAVAQNLTPTNLVAPALAPVPTQSQIQSQAVQPQISQPTMQPPAPPTAEMKELRQRFNSLSVRASALKEGLNMMEQRLQRQGFGLRVDMLDARKRLDYQLQEAMESIRKGDVEAAKQSLEYGEGSAVKIEKFLGQ